MSFSAGTFTLFNPGNPVVTGTTISSTWANSTLDDIATGLSTCLLKDGTQVVTANIPMAGFVFTGLGNGTAAGESIRWQQVFSDNGIKFSTTDGLTATGTTQNTSLALPSTINRVTTTAAGTGVKLYNGAAAGDMIVVYNGGANPLYVYPGNSQTINQLASEIPMTLPVNTTAQFFAVGATAWLGILSA